ncbi:MAG: hypothetical protein ABFD97_14160 [Syntrophobacter sp.]
MSGNHGLAPKIGIPPIHRVLSTHRPAESYPGLLRKPRHASAESRSIPLPMRLILVNNILRFRDRRIAHSCLASAAAGPMAVRENFDRMP